MKPDVCPARLMTFQPNVDLVHGHPATAQLCCLPRKATGFLSILVFRSWLCRPHSRLKPNRLLCTLSAFTPAVPNWNPAKGSAQQRDSESATSSCGRCSVGPRLRTPWVLAGRPGSQTNATGKASCLMAPSEVTLLIRDVTPSCDP